MSTPDWAEEIRQQYLSGAANQFLIHGNVNDRVLIDRDDEESMRKSDADESARMGNLIDFLTQVQLARFDLVISYQIGGGLRIESGEDFFRKLHFPDELPKDPPNAIGYLDQFLRFLVNLKRLSPTDPAAEGIAGRNHHIAVVIQSADLVFPMSRQTRDYQLSSMASVVRSWSHETHFLEQNLAVFLVTENLNDLHPLLAQNQRAATIEVPLPEQASLAHAFDYFKTLYPAALSNFVDSPELIAGRLAGASLSSIEALLKNRQYENEPLIESDLAELKKDLVEADSQGLIEFLEPTRSLADYYGQEPVKTWMRQDIALWQQGDLAAMPMGYLLCGPVGTGKTYLVECLAGEAGVPVVKMKNFRDRWVGSTEGNLEKIFSLLHALGRCIVFIDEADQALGNRDSGSGDSGVSGRVYSMMAKEMSDPDNRGRILWILASSRPDLIEVDLKRPGRVDVKIPIFPAHEAADAYRLIRALSKKHRLELPKECPEDLLAHIPTLVTPGAAEAIAIKLYRLVKTRELSPLEALRDSLEDYQNPIPPDVMDFQIGLAVREASDLDFVPEVFRGHEG
ncbi:MAG: AAA family ATPase [Verrucomicrobiota bacterium]